MLRSTLPRIRVSGFAICVIFYQDDAQALEQTSNYTFTGIRGKWCLSIVSMTFLLVSSPNIMRCKPPFHNAVLAKIQGLRILFHGASLLRCRLSSQNFRSGLRNDCDLQLTTSFRCGDHPILSRRHITLFGFCFVDLSLGVPQNRKPWSRRVFHDAIILRLATVSFSVPAQQILLPFHQHPRLYVPFSPSKQNARKAQHP